MKQIPGGVTAPKGFRAWGVHCGVKSKKADKKDLALILSDQECAAAAVYTMNRVKAAPLYLTMEHLEDRTAWAKKMLVNIAKAGFFSSDRTIAEYNHDIWHLK